MRHKKAVSSLAELAEGSSFHRVLWDDAEHNPELTTIRLKPWTTRSAAVIVCSGKVYYDLLDAREEAGADDVYILRLEQFYPWPMRSLLTELARFKTAELVWCQEEPRNMGGWTFIDPMIDGADLGAQCRSPPSGPAMSAGRPALRLDGGRADEPSYARS